MTRCGWCATTPRAGTSSTLSSGTRTTWSSTGAHTQLTSTLDCRIFTRVVARYVPKDRPRGQRFPVEGVEVELGQSDHSSVTLAAVSLATAGTIMCEVSTS